MWRRKWFIPAVLLPILLAGGIAGGVVAAADDTSNNATKDQSQPADRYQALLERVCVIYEENTGTAIDPEQLKDALAQARSEMQDEALQSWLQKVVDKGKITQEEVDQYLEWWQSRPDVTFGLGLRFGTKYGRGSGDWGGPC
jgi:23S rRNA G2069 N7-methylase RlmK/C1962 C5-methylase RlmI